MENKTSNTEQNEALNIAVVSGSYLRPKTRGELLDALINNVKCEVVAHNEEITNIMLDGWLKFENKYKTYPSENRGYVIYEAV